MLKTYLSPITLLIFLLIFVGLLAAFNYFVAAPKTGGYALPDDYESWPGEAKQNYLWQQIITKPYDVNNLPRIKLPPFKDMMGLFSQTYLDKTFSHVSDIMPPDRMKAVHWLGTLAKADFIASADSPYAGLLRGAKMIVRASLAAPVSGFTPGIGMKWFVDGKPSVNLVAMFSFDGQGENRNFFENSLTHRLPPPSSKFVQKLAFAFKKVKREPFQLEPHFLAVGGSAPYQLNFVPDPAVQKRFDPQSKTDIRKQFSDKLKIGDILYNVYAVAKAGEEPVLIGQIILTSEFVASQFGDEEFFLQHHMDESKTL